MRTRRQHAYFHIFGLYFLLFPLFLYHWQQPIVLRNTPPFGYEINVEMKNNSLSIYPLPVYFVGHVTELVGRCGGQWSSPWASESDGLGLFLTVPYCPGAMDKPWFSHLPNGGNNSST